MSYSVCCSLLFILISFSFYEALLEQETNLLGCVEGLIVHKLVLDELIWNFLCAKYHFYYKDSYSTCKALFQCFYYDDVSDKFISFYVSSPCDGDLLDEF